MTLVKSGDLIFSFCDTQIKAVGVALGPAQTADKPEFGVAGDNWEKEGWLIPVEFTEVATHVRPKDFIDEPHLGWEKIRLPHTQKLNSAVRIL